MKLDILGVILLAVAGPVLAITTSTPSPYAGKMGPMPAAAAPTAAPAAAAAANAMADDSSGLRKGTVEQVSVGGGTFHVYGQRLTFNTQRVKVFAKNGKPASIYSLRAGANVRFTMDPTDRSHRRVAVIYID